MLHPSQDLGGHIVNKDACSSANSGAPSLITAAAGLDNVEVDGQTLDRYIAASVAMADSSVITVAYLAALTATETLSLRIRYQDSANGSSWNTAVELTAAAVVATGAGGGSNERGALEASLNLRGLERYVRFSITADLSASGTDTCTYHAVAAFGGYDQVPRA